MPKRRNNNESSSSSSSRNYRRRSNENDSDDNDGLLDIQDEQQPSTVQFSQQIPDSTTTITEQQEIRESERTTFSALSKTVQDTMVTRLSRTIIFRALAGLPLDKSKLIKEAFDNDPALLKHKVANIVLTQACQNIHKVWGVQVHSIPQFLKDNKFLPAKYKKERLYVVNSIDDDNRGSHSKELHSFKVQSGVEKGLLMLVLAFVYCRGEVKDEMRWISSRVLYKLLHSIDEYIPEEPPSTDATTSSNKRTSKRSSVEEVTPRKSRSDSDSGVALTPNVDELLEKFVRMDYLLKKKSDRGRAGGAAVEEIEGQFSYAIGPRAIMEIGRKQIVYFCAEILEEQPCPTMLAEIENDGSGQDAVVEEEEHEEEEE